MYDVKVNYAEVVEWQTRCLQAAVRQRVGVQISSSAPFERNDGLYLSFFCLNDYPHDKQLNFM